MDLDPKWLSTIGLSLAILGVLIIFIWGPPQPEHTTGVSLGLEDGTPIDKSGKTVAEYNREVIKRKKFHTVMSRFGLILIMVGFALQLWVLWLPTKQKSESSSSEIAEKVTNSQQTKESHTIEKRNISHNNGLDKDARKNRPRTCQPGR